MADPLEQEIRKLRALFWSERDPEGRCFAPLADAYRRRGDFEEALELLEDGLDRHPDFASGHVVAGWTHLDRGQAESALLSFQRVIDLDPENVAAMRGTADAYEALGDHARALDLLRQVEALEPHGEGLEERLSALEDVLEEPSPGAPGSPAGSGALVRDERAASPSALEESDEDTWEEVLGGSLASEKSDELVWEDVTQPVPSVEEPSPPLEASEELETPGTTSGAPPSADVDEGRPDDDGPSTLETGGAPDAEPAERFREFLDLDDLGEAPLPFPADENALEPSAEAGEADLYPGPEAGASWVDPDLGSGVAGLVDDLDAPLAPGLEESELRHHGEDREIYTTTMGELYAQQGQYDRAVEIFRRLVDLDPDNEANRDRLHVLEALALGHAGMGRRMTGAGSPAVEDVGTEGPAAEGPTPGTPEEEGLVQHPWGEAPPTFDMSTPFAWAEDVEVEGEPPEERPVAMYFRRLLSWVPDVVGIDELAPDVEAESGERDTAANRTRHEANGREETAEGEGSRDAGESPHSAHAAAVLEEGTASPEKVTAIPGKVAESAEEAAGRPEKVAGGLEDAGVTEEGEAVTPEAARLGLEAGPGEPWVVPPVAPTWESGPPESDVALEATGEGDVPVQRGEPARDSEPPEPGPAPGETEEARNDEPDSESEGPVVDDEFQAWLRRFRQ